MNEPKLKKRRQCQEELDEIEINTMMFSYKISMLFTICIFLTSCNKNDCNGEEYYPSGIVKRQICRDNNNPNLFHDQTYYLDGSIESNYTIDIYTKKIHGIEYYDNGSIKEEVFFIDSTKVGVHKEFYEDGSLKFITTYENDLRHGYSIDYMKNGKISLINYCEKDVSLLVREYDTLGIFIEEGFQPIIKLQSDTVFKEQNYFSFDLSLLLPDSLVQERHLVYKYDLKSTAYKDSVLLNPKYQIDIPFTNKVSCKISIEHIRKSKMVFYGYIVDETGVLHSGIEKDITIL